MKKNKGYVGILSTIFLLFIGVMFISIMGIKEKEFSEEENRNLNTKPKLSIKELIDGSYSKDYEGYISDQFPGRKLFVQLKSKVNLLMGKAENNGVYLGKDNQLMEDFEEEPQETTDEKINVVNNFVNNYENINTSFMMIPTSVEILKDKLPAYAPVDSQLKYMEYIQEKLNPEIKFISPYEAFQNNKDEYLYYKTDHHWTSKGAYIAYLEYCNALNLEPQKEEEFNVELVANDFYGSLSSKIGEKRGKPDDVYVYIPKENGEVIVNYVTEQIKSSSLYSSKALDKKDKYEVFTGGNHSQINIKTLGDINKKLLIIKDSYANSFIPFLTSHYGEIDVVDLRYYTDNIDTLIKEKGITDILFLYNVNTFNSDSSILNLDLR